MGKAAVITVVVLACIASTSCNSVYSATVGKPDGKGDRVKGAIVSASASSAPVPPIAYHGGPVMVGEIHLYYIWYGNWSGNTAQAILTDFGTNIGSSPYFQINTTYYQNSSSPQYVSGPVRYLGSTADNYSQGTSLTDASVQAIVSSAIASGALPNDSNGIYFVLT